LTAPTDWVGFTNRLTSVRTVFWVIRKDAAAPTQCRFMLGDSSSWDFHSDCDHTIWSPYYASGAVTGGQTFVNGVAVNGTTESMPTSLAVVSLVTTSAVGGEQLLPRPQRRLRAARLGRRPGGAPRLMTSR
jgi:hypothetical protein